MSSNSISSSVVDVSGRSRDLRATRFRLVYRCLQVLRRKARIGGYWLAVISVGFAFLLRLLVDPWLGEQSPYLLFVVAVAVTGLYAGIRPALLAAAMGTVVAYFCFVPPRYAWGFAGMSDAAGFGVYVLGVGGVILLTHARIRTAKRAEEDRLRAEEILIKTERFSSAGQMASLLAHEINNPLAALTNIIFLLDQQPLNSQSRQLLSAGDDALNRVNRIASMTMGLFFEKDTPKPLRICEVIREVVETLMAVDRFKHIQLTRDFRCDRTLVASRPRIRQLIASLVTNAMESDASIVRLRVRIGMDWRQRRHAGICITIADNGKGIPPDIRERIFEPFFTTKSEKATGLGLWASRAIALRNDGKIRLRSAVAGPRKGTCVSVFLPILAEPGVSPNFGRAVAARK